MVSSDILECREPAGKAIDARPEIARALFDDGQLLGNHSYHHDYWRWLDPRYPELDRTQDAFRRQLGVCPAQPYRKQTTNNLVLYELVPTIDKIC